MIRKLVANQRGDVLLFTIGLLILMLVIGGVAVESRVLRRRGQRAAAGDGRRCPGGAGKPGFETRFQTVRPLPEIAAQNSLAGRRQRPPPVNLPLNTLIDPAGNIVLGVCGPAPHTPKPTPSVDGTR